MKDSVTTKSTDAEQPLGASGDDSRVQNSQANPTETAPSLTTPLEEVEIILFSPWKQPYVEAIIRTDDRHKREYIVTIWPDERNRIHE